MARDELKWEVVASMQSSLAEINRKLDLLLEIQSCGPETKEDRLVLTPECEKIVGMNRVSIWRKEKAKKFPRRVRLSGNKSAWRLSELRAWFADPENYRQPEKT